MQKEWVRLKELIGLYGFPQTIQGITQRAKQEGWYRRQVTGVKGRVFEYHISSLPPDIVRQINEREPSDQTEEKTEATSQQQTRNLYINETILTQAIELLDLKLQARKQPLTPLKKAKLIVYICNAYNKQNPVTPSGLDQLLDLTI
ncbi:DNA-binding protein [Orbaceae bacterium ac157xtp]